MLETKTQLQEIIGLSVKLHHELIDLSGPSQPEQSYVRP